MVYLRVDEQAAAAISTKSTADCCAAVRDHIVACGVAAAQIERASRTINNEDLVSAGEVLAVAAIAEIFIWRLGRELVDYFPAPAAS